MANIMVPTKGHCLVAIDSQRLFMVGGEANGAATGAAYIYENSAWTEVMPRPEAASFMGCGLITQGGALKVVAAGGMQSGPSVWIYDVGSNSWSKGNYFN